MDTDRTMRRVGVIMAGGSGERFWPLSRKRRPKQLLRLTHPAQTMLGEAVDRLAPLVAADHVYIVTGEHLVEPIQEAKVGVPEENVIAEPCKRNTAGALMYAAAHLLAKYGGDGSDISMAVTTADHLVGEPDLFVKTLDAALSAAEREDALATLGVVPDRPETGYGYIQIEGDALADDSSVNVFNVSAFHEKPNRERAEDFIATGRYFWNSGMFFWKVSTFLREFDHARPEFAQVTRQMAEALAKGDQQTVRTLFESLEDISIDYALMEHADKVLMARAEFPWDDVGAWPALERTYGADDGGNVSIGDAVLVDVTDSIIYNEPGADTMAVGVIGVEDLVVVVTKDAVLVAPKDRAQDVKKVVTRLKERGSGLV